MARPNPVVVLTLVAVATAAVPSRVDVSVHGGAGAASAQESPLEPIAERVIPELLQLAEWCEREKLLGSRMAAYEAVLAWRPDHADARRILGWRRDKDGVWQRSRPERALRDRVGLEGELAQRRAGIVDRALSECERLREALGPSRLREARLRLVVVAPDHEVLRASLGQARLANGRWARADAVAALAREDARKAEVAALRDTLGEPERIEVGALDARARSSAVRWAGLARTPAAVVATTFPFAEAREIALAVSIAPEVARAALPPPNAPRKGPDGHEPVGEDGTGKSEWWRQPRFYVVQSNLDRDALIKTLGSSLEPRKADLLRRVNTGFLDAELSIGVWTASAADRKEAAVRQRIGLYLHRTFGVSSDDGWIWEGIGLLLSGAVTGSKNLVFVQLRPPDRTVAAGGRAPRAWPLFEPGADWLAMASEVLHEAPPFNLATLLAKDVNAMDTEDLLVAHALGTWLVDGHPDQARSILARIGAGDVPVTVLEEELGARLPDIAADLRAWLVDMRHVE